MIAGLSAGAAAVVLAIVAVAAYQRGRRHGRVRMPASLVAELHDHKVRCIGEPAERVTLELGLLCEPERARGAPAAR